MDSEGKMLQVGEGQETPHAITITIVDPSALGNTSLSSSLVASVETQDGENPSSIVMVSGNDHDAKDILQTVTETHMGTEDLPIISNISNPEEEEEEEEVDEETIVHETKLSDSFDGGGEEADIGDPYEAVAPHCLVCNVDLTSNDSEDQIPVFKTQTSTSQRRVAVFLSGLIGQKLTSRKVHSDILCRRCFSLLDRVDSLEIEIRDTKEEIVNKYQDTVSVYGGRARRRKPATAKQTDYVFPKVEPEDEADQLLDMELDGNFEPQMDDLMEDDPHLHDDDWEPDFKKQRVKKETQDVSDPVSPPKRKRGRPRKDATKPKKVVTRTTPKPWTAHTTTESPDPHDNESSLNTEREKHNKCHGASSSTQRLPSSSTQRLPSSSTQRLPSSSTPRLPSSSTQRLPSPSVTSKEVPERRAIQPSLSRQCPVCFTTCFNISYLRNHFKQVHSDVKSVKCIQCSEQIDGNFDDFVAHWKSPQCGSGTRAGRSPKMRECHVCHKQVRASGYFHHLATHKPVPCPKCNNQVAQRNLKRHINYCHNKTVLYRCDDCPGVYHDASHLLSHRKRNHLGQEVRKHLCEVCGKKFITPSDLRTHVAGVHHNVKKFVCEYCGLSFKISSGLMYHRRLHTGEKPHTCHVCERAFMKPNALAKHVRRVHGLEYRGKYRKRIKPPEPLAKATQSHSQSHSNLAVSKPLGVVVPPLPEVEQDGPNITSTAMKEAVQHESEDEGLRLMYSLSEEGVVRVVNLQQPPQTIQNLQYFRSSSVERGEARSYEATAPLHTISYYRQNTEEQYTVAELLPPQNTQEPSCSYPDTVTPPEPVQS